MLSKHSLYDFKEKIGHGSFGEVWLVKNRNTGKKCVLKKLKLSSCSHVEKQRAILEAQLFATLRHSNIVTYHDSFFHPHEASKGQKKERILNIVMCFCEGGDLYEYIQKQKNKLIEEGQIVEWLIQLCMALKYLNDKRILHRDLKTRNIFLTRKGIIKLGDFGIARVLDGTLDMAATQIGTPYYMSPEILTGKPYNHKSDIWSLGCCVFEMASLKHAFRARNFNSLLFKVLHFKPPEIPSSYSQELSALTSAMLNTEPEQRPSADSLLEHSFIHKHIFRFLETTKNRSSVVPDRIDINSLQDYTSRNVNTPAAEETGPEIHQVELKSQVIPIDDKPVRHIYKIPSKNDIQNGRTFSVDNLCELQEICEEVPLVTEKRKAVMQPELSHRPEHKLSVNVDQVCVSKMVAPTRREEIQVLRPEGCPPSDARLRRRQLRKFSCDGDFISDFDTKDEIQNSTSCQNQRQNVSARQRRRARLNQENISSEEGNGKSRPKSAPSRFSKIT